MCARGSKPKLISLGMIIVFIGCMINVLPHFLKHLLTSSSSDSKVHLSTNETTFDDTLTGNLIELCNNTLYISEISGTKPFFLRKNLTSTIGSDYSIDVKVTAPSTASFGFSFQLKHLLYLGNLINGMSTASLTTITFAYIEEIAPHSRASIYESIYYVVGSFGVFILKVKILLI